MNSYSECSFVLNELLQRNSNEQGGKLRSKVHASVPPLDMYLVFALRYVAPGAPVFTHSSYLWRTRIGIPTHMQMSADM